MASDVLQQRPPAAAGGGVELVDEDGTEGDEVGLGDGEGVAEACFGHHLSRGQALDSSAAYRFDSRTLSP